MPAPRRVKWAEYDVQKAFDDLHGLVVGISCDYELTKQEVEALRDWLRRHKELPDSRVIQEISRLSLRVLDDGKVDEQ